MGSHCGGRVPRHKASGVETPYSPSPKGDALAFGHPTAGASLSRMGEDRAASPKSKLR
ncbi:MAG: hypothetical protein V7K48_33385 [Nostoc sp.]